MRLVAWPLLGTLLVVTIGFYVLFSPLRIDGDSMVPSLADGDRVLRTKTYGEPRRGDVVVIDVRSSENDDDIVKRVIGVGGDTVEVRDDVAIVNGRAESQSGIRLALGQGVDQPPITVPEDSVYVMGDNRPVSLDSRYVGVFPAERIRGRVAFVFLPLSDFGSVY